MDRPTITVACRACGARTTWAPTKAEYEKAIRIVLSLDEPGRCTECHSRDLALSGSKRGRI